MNKELRNKLFRFLRYGDARKKSEIVEDMKELDGEFEAEFPWFEHPSSGCPVFYEDVREAMTGEYYEMSPVGSALKWVIRAINQGIDAHLEACFLPGDDRAGDPELAGYSDLRLGRSDNCSYLSKKIAVLNDMDVHGIHDEGRGRMELSLSPESLPVLLRRLTELDNPEDPEQESDHPGSLVSDILDTLGFDDTGRLRPKEERNHE